AAGRGPPALGGRASPGRAEAGGPPGRLGRLAPCWWVTVGLMFVHPLTALMFQARHMRLALKVGEPYRVARALALEAGFRAAAGTKEARRAEALLGQARALSAEIANPHARAVAPCAGGFVRYFEGRWGRALEVLDAAEASLREHCTGVAWELHATQLHSLWCLYHLGRAHEIERRLERLLEHVRRRPDLFLEACLNTMFLPFLPVARADPT